MLHKSEKITLLETLVKEKDKLRRGAEKKIEDIGNSVFDLKAVNPNVVVKVDLRTPRQVIKSIENQGKIVADALKKLNAMLD